jgi:cell division protein FtsL
VTAWGRARIALVALAVAAILFVFVFPTRSYLAQRRQVGAAQHDLDVLRKQNRALETEAARLQTPAAIKDMARQQFHMVLPGEELYRVEPAPAAGPGPTSAASPTTTVP